MPLTASRPRGRGAARSAALAALAVAASLVWGTGAATGAAPPGRWSVAATLPTIDARALLAISCADAAHCVAVGQRATKEGLAIATADGGATWQQSASATLNVPGLSLDAVSCVPSSAGAYCVAFGSSTSSPGGMAFYSSDDGATWTAGTLPTDSTRVIDSVSCGAGTVPPTCAAGGWGLYDSVDGGATWALSTSLPDDGSQQLTSVSCANAEDCVAGGTRSPTTTSSSDDFYTTDGGTVWVPATPDGATALADLSCASAPAPGVHCVAVDGSHSFYADLGGGWTKGHGRLALPATSASFAGVSCAAVQAWVAVTWTSSGAGVLYADDGGDYWTAPPSGPGALTKVHGWVDRALSSSSAGVLSCAATACFAVARGAGGASLILTGPSQLSPVYLGEPDARQVRSLVAASVQIEKLSDAVVAAVPAAAADDAAHWYGLPRTCPTVTSCVTGDVAGTKTLVVYGDSHARMWLPAILPAVTADGYRVVVLGEDGCTVVSMDLSGTRFHVCAAIQLEALAAIAALKPAAVILSDRTTYPYLSGEKWKAGMALTIRRIRADGAKVAVIGDIQALSQYPETCLLAHRSAAQRCAQRNPNKAEPGLEWAERAAAKATGALYVNPTPWLCTTYWCSEVIGSDVAYWDWHHVAAGYSQLLSNVMASALAPLLR